MNRKNPLLTLLAGVLVLTGLFSCGENRWAEYYPQTGRDLWIDSLMREVYLWYDEIPSFESLNYFTDPETFLKNVISSNDKNYSSVDTIDPAPTTGYGFEYTLSKVTSSDTTYLALVSYVMTDSPAADAGLKRGEWIMLVDGDSITRNTEALLKEGGTRELRIGKYIMVEADTDTDTNDADTDGDDADAETTMVGVVVEDHNLTLPAVRSVTDEVLHASALIDLTGTDRRVGYLTYNAFSSGTTSNPQLYNDQLRSFSQTCRQAGVNEFVLDLRYNDGGDMECVQLLATILAPADKLGATFASLEYNDKQSARNRDLALDADLLQGGANLNLSRVYMLTSSTTAGAAEMLINCLKPHMEVVLIGQTTIGQYVATEPYTNPRYPWVVRPVVCRVYNAEGAADYASGFTPDVSVSESSNLIGFLPLGDVNETLFNTALNIIVGNIELTQ